MIKLSDKPTVFFDVDSTLVFTQSECPINQTEFGHDEFIITEGRFKRVFTVHKPHIECIKDFKARGHNVVVWSAGGADWAALVIEKLELTDYVDVVMCKPDWYFDDLSVDQWIGKHCYITFNGFNPIKKDA